MSVKNYENGKKCRRIIICPNCGRSIFCPSSKNCTVYMKCRPCREEEKSDFIEMIREIISYEKGSNQTLKEAIREYLINPNSIHIKAARKKRYRNTKWRERMLQEKKALGLLDNQHDLSDIKTIQNIISEFYLPKGFSTKETSRKWQKRIRLIAKEIITRRTFIPIEKRRSNLKRPYMEALRKQTEYIKIVFMLCG